MPRGFGLLIQPVKPVAAEVMDRGSSSQAAAVLAMHASPYAPAIVHSADLSGCCRPSARCGACCGRRSSEARAYAWVMEGRVETNAPGCSPCLCGASADAVRVRYYDRPPFRRRRRCGACCCSGDGTALPPPPRLTTVTELGPACFFCNVQACCVKPCFGDAVVVERERCCGGLARGTASYCACAAPLCYAPVVCFLADGPAFLTALRGALEAYETRAAGVAAAAAANTDVGQWPLPVGGKEAKYKSSAAAKYAAPEPEPSFK